jgi:hypothetical protein
VTLSADAIQDIGNLLDDKLDERDRKLAESFDARDRKLEERLGLRDRKLHEKLDERDRRLDERLDAIGQDLISRLDALGRAQPSLAGWLEPSAEGRAPGGGEPAAAPASAAERFEQIERRLDRLEELLAQLHSDMGR